MKRGGFEHHDPGLSRTLRIFTTWDDKFFSELSFSVLTLSTADEAEEEGLRDVIP